MGREARGKKSHGGLTWLLALVILAGAGARIALLTDNRFHPDEALFAALGRLIISGRDPLLSETALLVDKPPLFYCMLAGGIGICWVCELTARLPGLWAGLISLALVARLAWQLWRSEVAAVLAALVYAFSPFAILFAPTVFSDPQLTMWLLGAMVAVSAGRWGWGGLLFGLGLATKQNALFFVPLVVGLGVVGSAGRETGLREFVKWALRFGLGLGLVVAGMVGWDAARQTGEGFWLAGIVVNNPGRVIRSNEFWSRAVAWLGWLRYFGGGAAQGAGLLGVMVGLVGYEMTARRRTRGAAVTVVLVTFMVGYLIVHWLVAFPVFDRYLLPLVPLAGLLVGRAGDVVVEGVRARGGRAYKGAGWVAGLVVCLVLVGPARRAMVGEYPVGGDHGAYDGIERTAAFLDGLEDGSVVYNQSLGWLLNYYLFDAYVNPVTFDTPAALANDLEVFGGDGSGRYLVLSRWDSPTEVLAAVEGAGFSYGVVFEAYGRDGVRSFVVYRLRRGG